MTQKERLVELIKPYMLGLSAANCEKLAEYLIHNGVIVPPCKVGDKLYFFEPHFDAKKQIKVGKAARISVTEYDEIAIMCNDVCGFYYRNFNNVWFTREEAEQALKEREEA